MSDDTYPPHAPQIVDLQPRAVEAIQATRGDIEDQVPTLADAVGFHAVMQNIQYLIHSARPDADARKLLSALFKVCKDQRGTWQAMVESFLDLPIETFDELVKARQADLAKQAAEEVARAETELAKDGEAPLTTEERNMVRLRSRTEPGTIMQDRAEAAERLWQLLDDIDTLSDATKGNLEAFYRSAMCICNKRCRYAMSPDGYSLVWRRAGETEEQFDARLGNLPRTTPRSSPPDGRRLLRPR